MPDYRLTFWLLRNICKENGMLIFIYFLNSTCGKASHETLISKWLYATRTLLSIVKRSSNPEAVKENLHPINAFRGKTNIWIPTVFIKKITARRNGRANFSRPAFSCRLSVKRNGRTRAI